MIDLEGQFHVQRAMKQSDLAQNEMEKQKQTNLTDDQKEIIPQKSWKGLQRGVGLLFTGTALGAMSGFLIGLAFGIKRKHLQPLQVATQTGIKVGLVCGQFAGIRYIVPDGFQKFYMNYLASDEEKILNHSFALQTFFPGLNLPSFTEEWGEKQYSSLGSGVSGFLAGYLLTRLQAIELSKSLANQSHLNSLGLRGGLFWGLVFGCGHYLFYTFDEYKTEYLIKRKLRELYENDQIKKLLNLSDHEKIPERKDIVSLSWKQIIDNPHLLFKEYGWSIPNWMPLVHTEEDYEYRKKLENEHKLLLDQVRTLENKHKLNKEKIDKEKISQIK